MYRAEENCKIGEYIGKLIARKYGADRQFAIAYIKLRDWFIFLPNLKLKQTEKRSVS